MSRKSVDLVIFNIGQLLTMTDGGLGVIQNAVIVVDKGIIIDVGNFDIQRQYDPKETINAEAKVVTPGLIDCHTHLIFGGSRENEMVQRLAGESYLAILKSGGGIISTVKSTQNASKEALLSDGKKWLDIALRYGITALEIKSGYGLDDENELKQLEVIAELKNNGSQTIIPTFLAHAFPTRCDTPLLKQQYIDALRAKMLPNFKKYADFVDIFIEDGVFSAEQADLILSAAKQLGYKLKMHVNQINSIGGIELAVKHQVLSVDHLDTVREEEIALLSKINTTAVLLPGASYFLNCTSVSDVANLSKYKIPMAIATNFNPGSCPSLNIHLMMSLAVHRFGMTPEQAWQGVTLNAARALGLEQELGSIVVGKKAHIVIWDMKNYLMPFYHFGHNFVKYVIIEEKINHF